MSEHRKREKNFTTTEKENFIEILREYDSIYGKSLKTHRRNWHEITRLFNLNPSHHQRNARQLKTLLKDLKRLASRRNQSLELVVTPSRQSSQKSNHSLDNVSLGTSQVEAKSFSGMYPFGHVATDLMSTMESVNDCMDIIKQEFGLTEESSSMPMGEIAMGSTNPGALSNSMTYLNGMSGSNYYDGAMNARSGTEQEERELRLKWIRRKMEMEEELHATRMDILSTIRDKIEKMPSL